MHLRVGLGEIHRQPGPAAAGHVELRNGEVDPEGAGTRCSADQVDRDLAGAAADVTDPVSRTRVSGRQTVYSITAAGRRALAAWLAEPGDGPVLEFEGLVKLMFADHGSRADALETIARARAWAVEMNADNMAAAERFAEAGGRYEERRATTLLTGAFLTDFYALVAQWAEWAAAEVEGWPDDIAGHRTAPELTRAVLARAKWSQSDDPSEK